MEEVNIELTFTGQSRAFCSECDFLKSRCLCDTLKSTPNNIHLIILQHPSETKHPLNTVRIMKKSFKEMTVIVGEDFHNDISLNTLICDPKNECALLYPGEASVVLDSHFKSRSLTHIILIDGTWRKAKKIFMLSKNLHALPSYRLATTANSDYLIRKSPHKNALSTLEATVHALQYIEPELNTEAVVASFQKMINMQIKKMGREIYQNHYLGKKKE